MKHNQINRMAALGILSAIIVVLQLLSTVFKIGTVSITLTLIPIVVGAAFYGASAGAILGAVFGVIVYINCVTGLDPGGNMLFVANPFLTAIVCLVKGAAAGWGAGLIYHAVAKKGCSETRSFVAVLLSACAAPIINTGLFCLAMPIFFLDTLKAWAGDSNLLSYAILGLAGINFVVEFAINLVCSPAITTVIRAVQKNRT